MIEFYLPQHLWPTKGLIENITFIEKCRLVSLSEKLGFNKRSLGLAVNWGMLFKRIPEYLTSNLGIEKNKFDILLDSRLEAEALLFVLMHEVGHVVTISNWQDTGWLNGEKIAKPGQEQLERAAEDYSLGELLKFLGAKKLTEFVTKSQLQMNRLL
jgi:hypothetical protein